MTKNNSEIYSKMGKVNISYSVINDSSVNILVQGDASINSEEEFYLQTLPLIAVYDFFKVDLKNVEVIDLTFIQLLLSLKNTLKSKNKNYIFTLDISEQMKTILDNSGIDINEYLQ